MGTTLLEVSDEEVTLLRHALRHYLSEFGHNEADVLRETKKLLAKLPQATPASKAGQPQT
jgi:hypothetical protein